MHSTEEKSIYQNSLAVQKIKKQLENKQLLKLAFLDVDGTLTGPYETQLQVRKELERQGYLIIFVTSRYAEIMLSDKALKQSPTLQKPLSKSASDANGLRYHKDLSEIDEFKGLLDGDIISHTSGLRTLVRQISGEYLEDNSLLESITIPINEWREKALQLVLSSCPTAIVRDIDIKENYDLNKTDVLSQDYRVILDFPDSGSMKKCLEKIIEIQKQNSSFPLEYVNDSHPEKNHFSLYLIAFGGNQIKRLAVDKIVENIIEETKITAKDLKIFLNGDAYIDLEMGLLAADGTESVFLLAGASRLFKSLSDDTVFNFDLEDIKNVKEHLKNIGTGVYTFHNRTIIFSDLLYPGKVGAESILAFLHDDRYNWTV